MSIFSGLTETVNQILDSLDVSVNTYIALGDGMGDGEIKSG